MQFFLISFGAYRKKCYLCIVILKTLNYQLTPRRVLPITVKMSVGQRGSSIIKYSSF